MARRKYRRYGRRRGGYSGRRTTREALNNQAQGRSFTRALLPMAKFSMGILPNGGLPDKLFTKFVYSDSFKLQGTGTTLVAQAYQYRLNSLFDPDLTGGGHQPYMRDQLSAFYRYAAIYATKVELCVTAMSGTTEPHLVVIRPTKQSSAPLNIGLEKERPFSKFTCVNSGQDVKRLKMYIPMHKLFGIRKSTLEDDDHRITIGSSPNQTAFLNIVQAPIPDSDTTQQYLAYTLKLTFYTKLWSSIDQNES